MKHIIEKIGALADRVIASFYTPRHQLKEMLVMYGEDEAVAAAIESMLDARRSRNVTRARVSQFAAKGTASYHELAAILGDAPGMLLPHNSDVLKRLSETNTVLLWAEFVEALDLPPNP